MTNHRISFTFFFLILCFSIIGAEDSKIWDWHKAEPQEFDDSHDNYVIAVGDKTDPLTLGQEEINRTIAALFLGKEVRFRHVKILCKFEYHGKIEKDFNFAYSEFSGSANFRDADFYGIADFYSATFSKEVNFRDASFARVSFAFAEFHGYANFVLAEFPMGASFLVAKFFQGGSFYVASFDEAAIFDSAKFSKATSFNTTFFHKAASFYDAKFSEVVDFQEASLTDADFGAAIFCNFANFHVAKFSKVADFGSTKFSAKADFRNAKFLQKAFFNGVEFSGYPRFNNSIFAEETNFEGSIFTSGGSFNSAKFMERTNFSNARFYKHIIFSNSQFRNEVDFRSCLFPKKKNGKIDFTNVRNFSPMVSIQWEGNSEECHNLKQSLEYNDVFYLALMKNYQELGLWQEADDIFFQYRKEERIRKTWWTKSFPEFWFLEFPFGYGVRPWYLVRTFVIFWIAFGICYAFFLRHWTKNSFLWQRQSAISEKFWGFVWALLHSLNKLTPGIDFETLADPFLKNKL